MGKLSYIGEYGHESAVRRHTFANVFLQPLSANTH